MQIDAHQHFWKISRNDYGWLTPDMEVLYRDFLPEDLAPCLDRNGVDKTIIVQAAPSLKETEFILALSDRSNRTAGVVGWIDLFSHNYKEQFEHFRTHPDFVGFRVMIQDMHNAEEVLKPHVVDAFSYFAQLNFPIDLLIRADQLSVVLQLLQRVPNLRGVIDHMAKPNIAQGIKEPWKMYMRQIAQYPTIYCKVSGMVTEANHDGWVLDDFVDYVHHVLDVFGPNRILYGSDWPVCLLAGSYDDVYRLAQDSLPSSLTEDDRKRIFGLNAIDFYRLNEQHLLQR